jgi:septal ring factor EnvC (AmiA/AmiB activator)
MIRALLILALAVSSAKALTKEELINQIQEKVAQQAKELEFAQQKAKDAIANSDRTHEELGRAQGQIDQVAKERDGWQAYGNDQHDKWMNAETRVAKEQAAVLRRNIVIGLMALAMIGYAAAKFYFRVPFL